MERERQSVVEKTGNAVKWGGLIAGAIGLLAQRIDVFTAGVVAFIGGYMLQGGRQQTRT